MAHVKLGVQLASLGLPLKRALIVASRMGVTGVEIDARREVRPAELSGTGRRQLRKMLDDLRLTICAVRFPTRRGYNVAEDLDQRVAATKEMLSFAYALGASVVVNAVGRIPEEPGGPGWDLLMTALSDIGRFGQRCGAMLAAETGSESADTMLRFLRALPDGSLGVNLDPGNLVVNGFSAQDAAQLLGPYVMQVHAKDGVRDLAQGRGLEVPLGRGAVDFEQLIATLDQQGFRGYYTVERNNARDAVAEIGASVEYLRSL